MKTTYLMRPMGTFFLSIALLLSGNLARASAETGFEFKPSGIGAPQETAGAGTRAGQRLNCVSREEPFQVLMPAQNFGLTLDTHPAIFVKLPATQARRVALVVRDETGDYFERVFLPLDRDRGIARFALPSDRPALEAGKTYTWSLTIACDGEFFAPGNPTFVGWVQRATDAVAIGQQLDRQSPTERARWYAENGYWYDLLDAVTVARPSRSDASLWHSRWQEVLRSAGLGELASQPLLVEENQ